MITFKAALNIALAVFWLLFLGFAQAEEEITADVDRHIDIGNGLVKMELGSLSPNGQFSANFTEVIPRVGPRQFELNNPVSLDPDSTRYFMTDNDLAKANGKFLMRIDGFEESDFKELRESGFLDKFSMSSERYTITGGVTGRVNDQRISTYAEIGLVPKLSVVAVDRKAHENANMTERTAKFMVSLSNTAVKDI
jgi:hypothetical protein